MPSISTPETMSPRLESFEASTALRLPRPHLAWPLALAACLLAGVALRLVWAEDMEYKSDERWTFEQTQLAGQTNTIPLHGMRASVGCDNPGMSVWVFVALAWLCRADDPVTLVRAVQLLNVAAVVLQVVFARWFVPAGQREPWYWSAALLAVNPLAVLFHRKIWPPSVLPVFIVLLLMCWSRRERRGAALGWGLIGALVGQVHMAGFHFAAAFALWTRLFGRQGVAWRSWFAGSALGALPLVPWLAHLASTQGQRPATKLKWGHLFEAKFWLHWCQEPFGFGIDYPLGDDFGDFLTQPTWQGHSTWLMAALHVSAGLAAVYIAIRAMRRPKPPGARRWFADESLNGLAQNSGLLGYGLLLTLSLVSIHRHYQIIALPLEMLWLARLTLGEGVATSRQRGTGRAILAALCLMQFTISAGFLCYVHAKQRIDGEYGTVYQAQRRAATEGLH
jgi:hypothetical protein